MQKLASILVICLSLCTVSALPTYEPFADATAQGGTAYVVGSLLVGQSNALLETWTRVGPGTTPQPSVAVNNLTYPGLPASVGNCAVFYPTNTTSSRIGFSATVTSGTVYFSCILKMTNLSQLNNSGQYFLTFNGAVGTKDSNIASPAGRLIAKKVAGGYQLGIAKDTSVTNNWIFDPTVRNNNQVLFVVVSYELNTNTLDDDVVRMWVNPATNYFGASTPPPEVAMAATGADMEPLRSFAIVCRNNQSVGGLVDELRIGRTWAFVTGGPEIGEQPAVQTVLNGTDAIIAPVVGGSAPLIYHWRKNGIDLTDGTKFAGANTDKLTIRSVSTSDEGYYSLFVTNSYGSSTGSDVALVVADPMILTQPSSLTAGPGGQAVFSITAGGTPPLTYQWYKDGYPCYDGWNASGAGSPSLTVANISSSDFGTYSVVVQNGLGASTTSSNAVLTISDPAISTQPISLTADYATTATFQIAAQGTEPLTYRWQKNGADLTDGGNVFGSQSPLLTIFAVSYLDAGSYTAFVDNASGSATSKVAVLTVRDPAIVSLPVSLTNNAGETAIFSVEAIGTPSLSYQWKKGTDNLVDGGKISGTTTPVLTITGINGSDSATYSVVVTSGSTRTATASAVLSVLEPVSILVPPSPRTVLAGSKAVFTVAASGTAPLSYQWKRNNLNIPGANSSIYIVTNVQAIDMGSYSVAVSNSLNTITSPAVSLTVLDQNAPLSTNNLVVIRVGDGSQPLTINGNSVFLDQFTTSGVYVSSVAIPDDGPSALIAVGPDNLNASFSGSSLTRSLNNKYLALAGYNTNLTYGASLKASPSTSVPRAIGVIDGNAQYRLAVSDTNVFTQSLVRGAIYDGTNNYWGFANSEGLYYYGFGFAPGFAETNWANLRSATVFNGDIYGSAANTSYNGIMKISGLPTTIATPTVLFSYNTRTTDFSVNPDGTLIYVADDSTSGSGGIARFQFDGSTWSLAYTLTNGLRGARYLTVDYRAPAPVIYAVSADDSYNQLVRIVDNGPGSEGATLAIAGLNQTFRGLCFGIGASENPATRLVVTRNGNSLTLTWSGTGVLQSSTRVEGGYSDIVGARSGYTTTVSGAARFFKLR